MLVGDDPKGTLSLPALDQCLMRFLLGLELRSSNYGIE